MSTRLILASGSPRRKELLNQIGVDFRVHPVDMDEAMLPGEGVLAHVSRLALEKARAGFEQTYQLGNARAVLGADTVVDIDGQILGKPANTRQAGVFLARLSGRKHQVHTAVALITRDTEQVEVSSSEVEFARLTEQQIHAYVKSGEPLDKAGAYAIQGIAGQFVVNLNGSYSGVMGLPLYETVKLLSAGGIAGLI